jgi:AcrR family transcriptional regulator
MSSVYHYFGSMEGILLAVMERGADRFFTDLPRGTGGRDGPPSTWRDRAHSRAPPPFPPAAHRPGGAAARRRRRRGAGGHRPHRGQARQLLRAQIGLAFGDDPHSPATDQLARFALAAIDGAFLACQADRGVTLGQLLQPLPAVLPAARRALLVTVS